MFKHNVTLSALSIFSMFTLVSCGPGDLSVITKPKTFEVLYKVENMINRKECNNAEELVNSFWNQKIDNWIRTISLVDIAQNCKGDLELARRYANEGIAAAPTEKGKRDLKAIFFNDGIFDEK